MNSTRERSTNHSYSERSPAIIILYFIHIPLTLLGNSLICWVVYKYHQLRTPNNIFVVSLSCVYMLYVISFVTHIILYFSPTTENSGFCLKFIVFYQYILLLTKIHLCVISIDRMLAIKYPLKYPLLVTNKRAIILAILLWIIAIFLIIVFFIITANDQSDFWKHMSRCHGSKYNTTKNNNTTRKNNPERKKAFLTCMIINFLSSYVVPLLIIMTSYAIIFKVIKGQSIKAYPETEQQAKRRCEIKAAKTIGLIVGAFLILYTPMYIASLVGVAAINKENMKQFKKDILRPLDLYASFAAWLNPVVYTFTNRDFKEHIKKIFKRICTKSQLNNCPV